MAAEYVRYDDNVETVEPDEQELIDTIMAAMRSGGDLTRPRHGRAVRTSHAKAHGLLKGELRVLDGLAAPLRQGLFAEPQTYPVIARLSHAPGEYLDDRGVSVPRGLALKILGVALPKLAAHEGQLTQDFLLDTGTIFNAMGLRTFLAQIQPMENVAPRLPEPVKAAVSTVARLANEALSAAHVNSSGLDFLGHPVRHPLAEPYYTQAPIRYGDYIAKLRIRPDTPALLALAEQAFAPQDENGLRTAVVDFFRSHPAEFEVAVQLCTDLTHMPVENPNVEWDEAESPYQAVARLSFPVQDAYSGARQMFVDEDLSFCPAHSATAHRPLGSIMRARMQAYEALATERRRQNGRPLAEPRRIDDMPD